MAQDINRVVGPYEEVAQDDPNIVERAAEPTPIRPSGRMITKRDIIGGARATFRDVPVEEWDGDSIRLFSLTDGQAAEVEAIRMRGMSIDMSGVDFGAAQQTAQAAKTRAGAELLRGSNVGMTMDMERMTRADYDADAQAVMYSLNNGKQERWTIMEVKDLQPSGVVAKLAAAVYDLSGMKKEDKEGLDSFRA